MNLPWTTRADRERVGAVLSDVAGWLDRIGLPVDLGRVRLVVSPFRCRPLLGGGRACYLRLRPGTGVVVIHYRAGRDEPVYDQMDLAHELAHAYAHQNVPGADEGDEEFFAATVGFERVKALGRRAEFRANSPLHQRALDRYAAASDPIADAVRALKGRELITTERGKPQ